MKLIITIDTEEDNWSNYHPTNNTTKNIESIIKLQNLFDQFSVTPTYLITYPVASNPFSVDILKSFLKEGKCEIGMHCHPWNTPPFFKDEPIIESDTMLCNLSYSSIFNKLSFLHETILNNFDIRPTSFRSGRYGFDKKVAKALISLNYIVDTSVTPYTNWDNIHGPDFSNFPPNLFWFDFNGNKVSGKSKLLEVPLTIGFLQNNYKFRYFLQKITSKSFFRFLKIRGLLYHLNILSKSFLSPEVETYETMIKLCQKIKNNNIPFLNLSLHSPSLSKGFSPFIKTEKDVELLFVKIKNFLTYSAESNWESQTLSQFAINQ